MSFRERAKKALAAVKRAIDAIEKDRVPVYAAQASFWVLFSVVPFTMLFIMVAGALSPLRADDLSAILAEILPEQFYSIATRLLGEVLRQVNIPLFSFITIILLWSVTLAFRSIGRGIQNIYGRESRPGTLKQLGRSALFVVIFLLTFTAAVAVLVLGASVEELLHSYLDFVPQFVWFIVNFRAAIFLVWLTLLFMFAYKSLARSDIPLTDQFPGAFAAALGWIVVSEIVSYYVGHFPRFAYVYGSLTVLILAMMWLYYCMTIFLLGAEFNKRRFLRNKDGGKSTKSKK